MLNRLKQFKAKCAGRFEVYADSSKDEATIYLYDQIGADWFGDGVTALNFVKELNGIKAKTIHLRINSPGGDVFEARAMQTALREHPANVIAHIDGMAASSASFLALGADEIEISEGGFFMIHNAWGVVMGNAGEMRGMADVLDKIDSSIVADYAAKSKKEDEEIREMMAAETWLTASEALEHGFVDRVCEPKKAKNQWDLSIYDRVPATLQAEKEIEKPVYDLENMKRRLKIA